MTSYPSSGAGRQEGSTTYVKSAVPLHGFAAPPKGYFAPSPSGGATAAAAAARTQTAAGSRSPLLTANDDVPPATSPSLVPTKGRRRESIGGQLRRNVSASTAAAAGAGGALGHSFLLSSRQQPIPTSRANNGSDVASLSTSMGAAAEALSLSSSLSRSSQGLTSSYSSTPGHHMKQERTASHTHFGQECYGPQPGETPLSPPASMLSSSAATARPSGMASAAAAAAGRPSAAPLSGSFSGSANAPRRPSVASSVAMEDDSEVTTGGKFSHTQMLHKCEACAKVYRHPSCLVKHRWEHTVYWKEASKFLMSKHQQVQLLEAAAILVGMDCNARSLPEEKALWPAAVSPPSSGLLGSDKVNFDKLMAQKHRKSDSPFSERSAMSPTGAGVGATPNSRYTPLPPTPNGGSIPRGSSVGLLSPLNALTTLNLGGSGAAQTPTSRMRGGAANGDVQHLQLDESAERTDRSGSADDDEDDDDDTDDIDTDSPAHQSDDRDTDDLGAGVEMQMEGVE